MTESERLPARISGQHFDPLLNDFVEKKKKLQQNVVLLTVELKEARNRLASLEEALLTETLTRKEAEIKTKLLEDEIFLLRKRLEEQDQKLHDSASTSYKEELDELRCRSEKTNQSLKNGEYRFNRIEEQLEVVCRELIREREASQNQLKDKIRKIEEDIMHLVIVTLVSKDLELRRTLDEVLDAKNTTEIMSCRHWKVTTQALESQLQECREANQEMKDRVLKLELQLEEVSYHSLLRQILLMLRLLTRFIKHVLLDYEFAFVVWMIRQLIQWLWTILYGIGKLIHAEFRSSIVKSIRLKAWKKCGFEVC